ncbi:SMU1112c/YaeR family gloxylase I-like metalloprotein [Dysosmobacter sp.]|uniref:SMU1112c/YaeR family gloxylase I-like metalloprotein n=1 Tax=Dysosmobacter sp. TaxID=2591382 RepID=UPI002A88439E|nr:VOC family protein [Dysosmobacter sp.]MDY3281403.1 VOC family protein [Dysosmobacter sp.]
MELSIHHTAIIASDYQAARTFYVEKLGLPVLSERFRPERGDWKIDLQAGNSRIELFVIPTAPPRPNYPEALGLRHLAFRVTDLDAAVRELEGKGIPCEPIRTDPVTGCRFTFFKDPDGLPLELYENQG